MQTIQRNQINVICNDMLWCYQAYGFQPNEYIIPFLKKGVQWFVSGLCAYLCLCDVRNWLALTAS